MHRSNNSNYNRAFTQIFRVSRMNPFSPFSYVKGHLLCQDVKCHWPWLLVFLCMLFCYLMFGWCYKLTTSYLLTALQNKPTKWSCEKRLRPFGETDEGFFLLWACQQPVPSPSSYFSLMIWFHPNDWVWIIPLWNDLCINVQGMDPDAPEDDEENDVEDADGDQEDVELL